MVNKLTLLERYFFHRQVTEYLKMVIDEKMLSNPQAQISCFGIGKNVYDFICVMLIFHSRNVKWENDV